jgi:hypothetical protein
VGLRDRDALILTVGLAIAVVAALPWRRVGAVALAILLADVAGWMGLALASHLRNGDSFTSIVLSALLVTSSAVGLAALAWDGFGWRRTPARSGRGTARPGLAAVTGLAWGVVAAVVVAVAPSMVAVPAAREGRLVVSIRNSRFSSRTLQTRAGLTTIVVANPDLFWHTFTVPDLHIDITVPVGSVRDAAANLPAGRYDFVCRVPGHNQMTGILVVA